MKQTFLLITLMATVMTACGYGRQDKDDFATDSVKFEDSSKVAEVIISVDFPAEGPQPLAGIVREYISEELGGTYSGNLTEATEMLAHYGKTLKDSLESMAKADGREDMPQYYIMRSILKTHETDKYITYTSSTETYYGGAHGMHTAYGTTFRKSDGRRLGYEMLINTDRKEFRALIKDGLKQYFTEDGQATISDEELKDMLLTESSTDFIPLPQFAPELGEDGVVFTYQPYEIAPYAAGMPSFIVPYDKIKPFMTVTALNLIK